MNFVFITNQLNILFIYLVLTQNPNGELKTNNNTHERNTIQDKKRNTVQYISQS